MEAETTQLTNQNRYLQLITFLVREKLIDPPSDRLPVRYKTSQHGLPATKQTPSPILNETNNNKEVTPSRENQGDRDLCVYQFFEDGSCPFNRCMFNRPYNFTGSTRLRRNERKNDSQATEDTIKESQERTKNTIQQ